MAESAKYVAKGGGSLVSDLKILSPFFRTRRRTIAFAYAFIFAFLAFTLFLAFTPSSNSASPLFSHIFVYDDATTASPTQFYTLTPPPPPPPARFHPNKPQSNASAFQLSTSNQQPKTGKVQKTNRTSIAAPKPRGNNTDNSNSHSPPKSKSSSQVKKKKKKNMMRESGKEKKRVDEKGVLSNFTDSRTESGRVRKTMNQTSMVNNKTASSNYSQVKGKGAAAVSNGEEKLLESLMKCNLYEGEWVRDDSYPLYKPGSCPLIDEQFDCFLNGRPDQHFHKLKWKPNACTLPRLDGSRMLELLSGKRLVFVGDSLNRNMWESLVCILRNSAKDQSRVFEASGRQSFRTTEASYSFLFQDYNCSVEFFVTPFLVQEWEVSNKNGSKKETLRLDMVERSSDNYKDADFIIFNTGHWWTHEKTQSGKDYYQEGSHVYNELNVMEAFRRALTTWGRWIDANVNPAKSSVFFRGYSSSHFSGGQWNSGGQCNSETEPIKNKTYLSEYPPMMTMLERVMKGMKSHATFMNVTRMTDYRKDGHPSIYRVRKQSLLSEDERRSPLKYQDCSHWCLPGIPDAWNELLYAELLIKQHSSQQQQQKIPADPGVQ